MLIRNAKCKMQNAKLSGHCVPIIMPTAGPNNYALSIKHYELKKPSVETEGFLELSVKNKFCKFNGFNDCIAFVNSHIT